MDDGTTFPDYKSFIKEIETKRKLKKIFIRALIAASLFLSGMYVQYSITIQ